MRSHIIDVPYAEILRTFKGPAAHSTSAEGAPLIHNFSYGAPKYGDLARFDIVFEPRPEDDHTKLSIPDHIEGWADPVVLDYVSTRVRRPVIFVGEYS